MAIEDNLSDNRYEKWGALIEHHKLDFKLIGLPELISEMPQLKNSVSCGCGPIQREYKIDNRCQAIAMKYSG